MSSEKGWCGASRDDRWKLLLRWQIQLHDQTSTQAEVSTLGWGRGRGRPSRGRRGRTCASQLDSVEQGVGFTRKSHNMREALCRDRYCEEEVDIACKWRATC